LLIVLPGEYFRVLLLANIEPTPKNVLGFFGLLILMLKAKVNQSLEKILSTDYVCECDEKHLEAELKIYEPFLKDTALILLDDITMTPGPKGLERAWDGIKWEKMSVPELHGSGFGIVFYVRA